MGELGHQNRAEDAQQAKVRQLIDRLGEVAATPSLPAGAQEVLQETAAALGTDTLGLPSPVEQRKRRILEKVRPVLDQQELQGFSEPAIDELGALLAAHARNVITEAAHAARTLDTVSRSHVVSANESLARSPTARWFNYARPLSIAPLTLGISSLLNEVVKYGLAGPLSRFYPGAGLVLLALVLIILLYRKE